MEPRGSFGSLLAARAGSKPAWHIPASAFLGTPWLEEILSLSYKIHWETVKKVSFFTPKLS